MDFHIPTAMQLTATMTLVIGIGLAFAATGYPRELQYPIRLWVRGLLIQPFPYILFALRGQIPDGLSIIAANGLLVVAFAHQMHALRVFNRQSDQRLWLVALLAVTLIGEMLLTYVWPSSQDRVVLMSLVIIALAGFGVSAIYQKQNRVSRPEHLVAAILLGGIGIMLVRVFSQSDAGMLELTSSSPLQGVVFTYSLLMPVIATSAFMLMCGERLNANLSRLATLDPLTGVYNRRTMAELANKAIAAAKRYDRPLSLLALDIDHFKRINDEFGHEAGDLALCATVELVRGALRGSDIVARLGGEEFIVILPDTDERDARALAERVRQRVADSGFTIGGWPAPLRVSIGAGALGPMANDLESLLREIDRALYTAKRAGRNRVVAVSQIDLSAYEPPSALFANS
jgi:diguanylate cyclase (GGDEF)-like protein